MKKYSAREIFSIPNIMSYFRLLLIPVFCYLYITAESMRDYYIAAAAVLVSSLTDLLDGKIARHFHMITELGKALDPVADKLTHAALAFCLAVRYPLMWALIALMVLKEGYMAVMGLRFLRYGRKLDGAMWFGKVCTAVLFAVLFLLFLVPNMPLLWVNLLIGATMAVMLFTLCMYVPEFRRMGRQCGQRADGAVTVCRAERTELGCLTELALLLWPAHTKEELEKELAHLFEKENAAFFLAWEGKDLAGFAQCQLRTDYVEGTESSPVGYLEGIYIKEACRNRGYAKALLQAGEDWSRRYGCLEFASDCEWDNSLSRTFHHHAGFAEAGRLIHFTKSL